MTLSWWKSFTFQKRVEVSVSALLSIALVVIHLTRLLRAGGLWRDEAAALQLATMPYVSDLFQWFPHEAFPPPFFLLVRAWVATFGDSDFAIRLFGFLCGVSTLAAIWWVMWTVRLSVPLISLVLIGFNSAFLTWGDELRGYGMGVLFVVLATGFVWRLLEKLTVPRAVVAAAAAICATQFLLHNAILVAAICLGAVALSWRRSQLRTAILVTLVGTAAAACLLPYIPRLRSAREWDMVVRTPEVFENVRAKLAEALGASGWWNIPVWALLVLWALAVAAVGGFASRKLGLPRETRDILLFCGVILAAGLMGYFLFLAVLGYPTQAWYYLALLAFTAVLMDLIFDCLKTVGWARLGRSWLSGVLALASLLPTLHSAQTRMTNIDLISHELEQRAAKEDLIIAMPWELGISFNRYYHGPAKWVTVPPIEFHKFHRYDLVKTEMVLTDQSEPIRPVLDAIKGTLNDGHRVWVVSLVAVSQPVDVIPDLLPAPNGKYGWDEQTHTGAWCIRVVAYIQGRSLRSDVLEVKSNRPVNRFEDLAVTVFSGRP